jgi:cell division septation protein DedD
MNPLYQHIEHLLLRHDCVIVPHFGGFVAQDAAARYVETEQLFFPPVRLIRFNSDLTIGDGLLLNHICKFYGYDESDGKRAIQTMVHQLRGQLLSDGIVDFGSLGIFSQNDDGDIEFSACQAGATTPMLYGLDAFSIPRLSERSLSHKAKRRALPRSIDDKPIWTINISRRTIRRALTTAAVILAVALFAVPIDMLRRHRIQTASVFPTTTMSVEAKDARQEVQAPADAASTKTNSSEAPVAPALKQAESTSTSDAAPSTVETTKKSGPSYAIVFASNISKNNAERYVAELAGKGIGGAKVMDNGRVVRVVVDGITTETEAYNQVRELHAMGSEFADVWVLKL